MYLCLHVGGVCVCACHGLSLLVLMHYVLRGVCTDVSKDTKFCATLCVWCGVCVVCVCGVCVCVVFDLVRSMGGCKCFLSREFAVCIL